MPPKARILLNAIIERIFSFGEVISEVFTLR